MNENELGNMIAIHSMKQNIKKIGQSEAFRIINQAIAEPKKSVYKRIFFQSVHELEGEV